MGHHLVWWIMMDSNHDMWFIWDFLATAMVIYIMGFILEHGDFSDFMRICPPGIEHSYGTWVIFNSSWITREESCFFSLWLTRNVDFVPSWNIIEPKWSNIYIWGWVKTYHYYGGITIHLPAIFVYHPGTRVLTHNHIYIPSGYD